MGLGLGLGFGFGFGFGLGVRVRGAHLVHDVDEVLDVLSAPRQIR